MYVPYLYSHNQFVFAETTGHKPYPARIVKIDGIKGTFTVSFIGYKSTSVVLASMMEKFSAENIRKYEKLYENSTDPIERTILRKINIAKKEESKYLTKKHGGKKGSAKSSQTGKEDFALSRKNEMHQQIGETKASTENCEEYKAIQEYKMAQSDDNQSSYFKTYKHKKAPQKQPNKKRQPREFQLNQDSRKVKELKETLNQLSPIRSNNDHSSQELPQAAQQNLFVSKQAKVKLEQLLRSQTASPELATAQTVSSAASLHFEFLQNWSKKNKKLQIQKAEAIKEEVSLSRNYIRNTNHPLFEENGYTIQHIGDQSSCESELEGKAINTCEDVNIFDVDCPIDEISVQDNDYNAMLHTMNYRKQRLSVLSPDEIISHLVKIVEILLQELQRGRSSRRARMLPMKKKQYLIIILTLKYLNLAHFLGGNCIFKMIQFACQYEETSLSVKSLFVVENFSIRSKLNILYLQLKKQKINEFSIEQSMKNELSTSFKRYKNLKFTYF